MFTAEVFFRLGEGTVGSQRGESSQSSMRRRCVVVDFRYACVPPATTNINTILLYCSCVYNYNLLSFFTVHHTHACVALALFSPITSARN